MDKYQIGLSKAYTGWGINAYQYDQDGYVVNDSYAEHPILDSKIPDVMKRSCRDCDCPVLYFEDDKIFYMGFEDKEQYLFILGPASLKRLTPEQLRAYKFKYQALGTGLNIPTPTFGQMMCCLSTVCYIITEVYYSEEQIMESNGRDAGVDEIDIFTYEFNHDNEEQERFQYEFELKRAELIERGELYLEEKKIGEQFGLIDNVGILAENDNLKQCEYMVVSAICMGSRAAIRGGIPPYKGYQLADLYMQRLSTCKNVVEMLRIYIKAMNDFSMQVKERLSQKRYGSHVEQCKNYIARNINHKIAVTDIADKIGVNSSYLSRKFSEQEGITIKQYMIKERLKRSANLLKNSNESIGRISDYTCFHSQSYYTKMFKEEYGMSPTEYRKKYRLIEL